MGTELPTKVMLGQTLVLMQMTLNNVRNVGRLVLSRTSCYNISCSYNTSRTISALANVLRTVEDTDNTNVENIRCASQVGEKWPLNFADEHLSCSQGSFTCRKSTTWDRRLYFPSEGRRATDFITLKIHRPQPGLNPRP
jgi:hypothetical protein